jgi:5-hmdU DNA kinase-like protein
MALRARLHLRGLRGLDERVTVREDLAERRDVLRQLSVVLRPAFEEGVELEPHVPGVRSAGQSIYSSAYIMPSPAFGDPRKHRNHLRLLERMMADRVPTQVAKAPSLESVFKLLLSYPSFGPFLAFGRRVEDGEPRGGRPR